MGSYAIVWMFTTQYAFTSDKVSRVSGKLSLSRDEPICFNGWRMDIANTFLLQSEINCCWRAGTGDDGRRTIVQTSSYNREGYGSCIRARRLPWSVSFPRGRRGWLNTGVGEIVKVGMAS